MKNGTFSLQKEDGQALVELAFAIPLLLFVLFAIIDFGLAINQYNDTTNLANLGARAVAVETSTSTAPTCPNGTASTSLTNYLQCTGANDNSALSSVKVCASDLTTAGAFTTGDTIQVQVDSQFSWFTIITGGDGRVGGLGPLNSTISSSATFRMEASNSTEPTWISTGNSTGC